MFKMKYNSTKFYTGEGSYETAYSNSSYNRFDYFKQINVSLVNQSINVKLKYRYFFSSLGYVCMYVLIYSFTL